MKVEQEYFQAKLHSNSKSIKGGFFFFRKKKIIPSGSLEDTESDKQL